MIDKRDHSVQAQSENAGRAFVHRIAAACGLIWREFTGQDIGIDGAIESAKDDHEGSRRGWALVQIKTKKGSFGKRFLAFHRTDRNHQYWLDQALPVLVCLIERGAGGLLPVKATFIDYKSVPSGAIRRTNKDYFSIDLEKLSDQGELIASIDEESLRKRLAEVSDWLRKVLRTNQEAAFQILLKDAEQLLEGGKPRRALQTIKKSGRVALNPKKFPSLEENSQVVVLKCLRRSGQLRTVQSLTKVLAAKPELQDKRLLRIAHYEQSFCLMVSALRNPQNKALWREAIREARSSAPSLRSQSSLNERLIAQTTITHIKAMQKACGQKVVGLMAEEERLRALLGKWRSRKESPDFSRRRINGRLVLVRSYLARKDVALAESEYKRVADLYKEPDGYQAPLWLAHLLVVRAWVLICKEDWGSARSLIELVTLAAAGFDKDPELRAYLQLLKTWLGKKGRAALLQSQPQGFR